MHATRPLYGRAVLSTVFLLLVATLPGGAGEVVLLEPQEGELVVGPTRFVFSVSEDGPPIERIDVYVEGRQIDSALPPDWSFEWDVPHSLMGAEYVAVVYGGGSTVETLRLQTSRLEFVEGIEVVEVQLFPVVVDRKGRYIGDLSADDFEVFDRDRPVKIKSFSRRAGTLGLAILLDVSESMREELTVVKEASCGFVDRLTAGDRISVFAFNHTLVPGSNLTAEFEEAKKSIRRLSAGGGTALYDALVQVLDDIGGVSGRKAVVLFSDGRDERSLTSLERAVEMARRSEVLIYAIAAGETEQDLAARDDLRLLAEETGGELHLIRKFKRLPQVYSSILNDLRAQYSLSFEPSAGRAGERRVRVEIKGERPYRVRCRQSYHYAGD